MLLSGIVAASTPEPARFMPSGQSQLDSGGRKVYIVQLAGAGAIGQAAPPRLRSTAVRPFPRDEARIENTAERLQSNQIEFVQSLGPGAELLYHYRYSFNGVAIKMTPQQAMSLRRRTGVIAIWEDSVRKVATNESPTFLNLFDDSNGLIGALDLKGEDIVIAVIDSGITPEHPSFSDKEKPRGPRLCDTSFAQSFLGLWLCRRYEVRPAELSYEPLPDWQGVCQAGQDFGAEDCNNKLIGARYFAEGALANQSIASNEILSARDADGHGTHIASTAAGNRVTARINGAIVARIQGIAPRARIAAYKACWLKTGAVRASCNTSDLAQAIDMAVADGVDIISYSIGNDEANITTPDALALLNATKAGVFSAVAAGNEGPALGTVGSPAGAPWVTAVAASSRTGSVFDEAIEVLEPSSNAGKIGVRQANFTITLAESGTVEESLVRVDDGNTDVVNQGEVGTTDDACQALDNRSELSGKVAFIRRTGCTFRTKIQNAFDAGAKGVVVYSNTGAPVTMSSNELGQIDIPAVMIGQADGETLLDLLADGTSVTVRLANGLFIDETDTGNRIANFSSRGPSLATPDILKPDVTAPGINILAATSPTKANGPQGEQFGYLSGTSMATPHVAGVAALLRQAHPDWSPAMLRSALMTSAYTDGVLRDAGVPADALDMGAGHISPNEANTPGLVFDASAADYDAFGCGDIAISDPARCTELASVGLSFAAVDFNQASISIDRLTDRRVIRREVTNLGAPAQYNAEVLTPPGFSIQVSPSAFSLGTGESLSYEVSIEQSASQLDAWYFGELAWLSDSNRISTPIALKVASVDAPASIDDAGGMGARSFPVKFGYSGNYLAGVHGLNPAIIVSDEVASDPDKNFDAEGCQDQGTTCFSYTVEPGSLYFRVALFDEFTDGNDDLDLFLFYCPGGADSGLCREVGVSGNVTSNEEISLLTPPGGTYLALVHGFETDNSVNGPGTQFSIFSWDISGVDAAGNLVEDNRGNLSVDAPILVSSGSTSNLTISWQDLTPDQRYLGIISHNSPGGTPAFTTINIRN